MLHAPRDGGSGDTGRRHSHFSRAGVGTRQSLAHGNPELCRHRVSTSPGLCSLQVTLKSVISHRKPEIRVPCVLGRDPLVCPSLWPLDSPTGLLDPSPRQPSFSIRTGWMAGGAFLDWLPALEDGGPRGLCEVSAASASLSQSWCHIFIHNLSRRWVFLYITCWPSSGNQSHTLADLETCLSQPVRTAAL